MLLFKYKGIREQKFLRVIKKKKNKTKLSSNGVQLIKKLILKMENFGMEITHQVPGSVLDTGILR